MEILVPLSIATNILYFAGSQIQMWWLTRKLQAREELCDAQREYIRQLEIRLEQYEETESL